MAEPLDYRVTYCISASERHALEETARRSRRTLSYVSREALLRLLSDLDRVDGAKAARA
jgi:hypothetical protein